MDTMQITLPWATAMLLYRPHIQMALVKQDDMTPNEARAFWTLHRNTYNERIQEIIDMAVTTREREIQLAQSQRLMQDFAKETIECAKDFPKATGYIQAVVDMYRDTLEWDKAGRTYEGWLKLMTKFLLHLGHAEIDSMGRMAAIAAQILDGDLRPFFEAECGTEPRDTEMVMLKIVHYEDTIRAINESNS